MSWIAAPLGLVACVSMAAPACCHAVPDVPSGHHQPGHPGNAPDQPLGCHAVLGCSAHRKPRTIP